LPDRGTYRLQLNVKVSDRGQPPLTLDFGLSESAGSRSLHRLVGMTGLMAGKWQRGLGPVVCHLLKCHGKIRVDKPIKSLRANCINCVAIANHVGDITP
jgi:hypothetical protein